MAFYIRQEKPEKYFAESYNTRWTVFCQVGCAIFKPTSFPKCGCHGRHLASFTLKKIALLQCKPACSVHT